MQVAASISLAIGVLPALPVTATILAALRRVPRVGEVLQRALGVGDGEERFIRHIGGHAGDECCGGVCGEGSADEIMAVVVVALERDIKIALFERASVDRRQRGGGGRGSPVAGEGGGGGGWLATPMVAASGRRANSIASCSGVPRPRGPP